MIAYAIQPNAELFFESGGYGLVTQILTRDAPRSRAHHLPDDAPRALFVQVTAEILNNDIPSGSYNVIVGSKVLLSGPIGPTGPPGRARVGHL